MTSDRRALARVLGRLRGVPAARAVCAECVAELALLRPRAVIALGSLAGGAHRPDAWSDLDLAIVLPDRRRLRTFRGRVPELVAARGRLLAGAPGPDPDQWLALVERDGVLVKVDVHVVTLARLREAAPRFVVVHGPAIPTRVTAAGRAAVDDAAGGRAASLAFAALARIERGDPLEAALLLGRARDALVPALRHAAGAPPGGVRGLERLLTPVWRRRLRATWPSRPAAREVRGAVRALARLALHCDAAPGAFRALLRADTGRR